MVPVAEPARRGILADLFDSTQPLVHSRNVGNEDEFLTYRVFRLRNEFQTELPRDFIVLDELLRRADERQVVVSCLMPDTVALDHASFAEVDFEDDVFGQSGKQTLHPISVTAVAERDQFFGG